MFDAGGLSAVLPFIRDNGNRVHKDTLHSSMTVVSRLCTKMEPADAQLPTCVQALSTLLQHEDAHVAEGALRCFASVADRFTRRGVDPAPLAQHGKLFRWFIGITGNVYRFSKGPKMGQFKNINIFFNKFNLYINYFLKSVPNNH